MSAAIENRKEPEACINLSLKKADRIINSVYNRHLSECGLSASQFSTLRVINFVGMCSSQVIQDILILDQTTLSRNLKKMVSDGLIGVKEDKNDRRRRLLSLTAKGKTLCDAGEKRWNEAQTEIKSVLGERMASMVIELSENIVEKCSQHYDLN